MIKSGAIAYACLILADDDLSVTSEKIKQILAAANLYVDSYMPSIYEQALSTMSTRQIITMFAGGVGAAGAPATADGSAESVEKKTANG